MTKQIPSGYKQTKVGIIPKDWEVEKVQKIFKKLSSPVEVNPQSLYQEIGIRSHGKGVFYKERISGHDLGNKSVFWIHPDCLILNIVFAWEQAIAKTTKNEIGFIASHRFPMYKPDQERVALDFYLYFFKSKRGKLSLELASPGGAGRNKTLGQLEFAKLDVPLPPKKEQEKIAEILSTWDDTIAKQEELIKQKQVFKKGIMQQIFSQKIRFKDDNGNDYPTWQEKSLGMIGHTYSGLSGKTKDDFGIGSPYITYKQIFDSITIDIDKFEYVNINENEKQSTVKYGDAFFTTSSETPNEVGMSSLYLSNIETSIYLNSFCFGYRFSHNILFPQFASYLFRSQNFRYKVMELAQGSTRFNISKNQMMKITDYFPHIGEQIKIADFLTNMDDEITKQTEILDQLKLQKQSLMQKLLTGQVRCLL